MTQSSACQPWLPDPNPILPWIDGSYTTPCDTTDRQYVRCQFALIGSDFADDRAKQDVHGWLALKFNHVKKCRNISRGSDDDAMQGGWR